MARPVRIAVDIGGTFTDVAMIAPDGRLATCKLHSTPTDYADAVIEGVQTLIGQQGLVSDTIEEVLHGCTVATNAILEHRGAKTALITTKGFSGCSRAETHARSPVVRRVVPEAPAAGPRDDGDLKWPNEWTPPAKWCRRLT